MKDYLFKEELNKRTQYAQDVIDRFSLKAGAYDEELVQAMNYSLEAGGKRLRPILIDAFYRLFEGQGTAAEPFMAAMEMIHTYSLVHDDLPAIDNDELRRGKPTTHKEFGEPLAILAGDGLLHEAFHTVTQSLAERTITSDSDVRCLTGSIKALNILAEKSGIQGMLGGQTADVIHTGTIVSDEMMMYIYEYKTGALIAGSMMIGAALAGASDEELGTIEHIGNLIGLAFQIRDDILDCTGDEKILGKPVLSDERNDKKTYLTIHGLWQAEKDVADHTTEAVRLLRTLNGNRKETEFLEDLFSYLVKRDK